MSGQAGATIYSMAAVTCSDIHTALIRRLAHMQNVFASVSREVHDLAADARTMDMKAAADTDRRDPTVFNGAGGGKVRGTAPVIAPPSDRFDLGSNDMPAPHWHEANAAQYTFEAGPGAFDSAGTFTEPIFDTSSSTGWATSRMSSVRWAFSALETISSAVLVGIGMPCASTHSS